MPNIVELPDDLLLKIHDSLTPGDGSSLASTQKQFSDLHKDPSLWKNKLERHFPHVFKALPDQKPIDWRAKYQAVYAEEYKSLTPQQRRLFSLVKEGDIQQLKTELESKETDSKAPESKEARTPPILQLLDLADRRGYSLFDWILAQKNQQLLDYFYQRLIYPYYQAHGGGAAADPTGNRRNELYWALMCRQDASYIQALLEQGYDTSAVYFPNAQRPYQLIHIAAEQGYLNVVQYLVQRSPALARAINDPSVGTPLYLAAKHGHATIVEWLLNNGATVVTEDGRDDMESRGDAFYFPIHAASYFGHLDVVKVLLRYHPHLINTLALDSTPLCSAIRAGHLHLVEYLLESKRNPQAITTPEEKTNYYEYPMIRALLLMDKAHLRDRGKALVAILLKHQVAIPVDHTAFTTNYLKCLYEATIRTGRLDFVQILFDQYPQLLPRSTQFGNNTSHALFSAVEAGHLDIVQYLLKKRGTNSQLWNDHHALSIAITNGRDDIAEALILAGITGGSRTAEVLQLAVKKQRSCLVKIILKQKPELALELQDDPYILSGALKNGDDEIAETLILAGITGGSETTNMLKLAVEKRRSHLVDLILRQKPSLAQAALFYAIQAGDAKEVKRLVDQKAIPLECTNQNKDTPLSYALEKGKIDIAEDFIQQGASIPAAILGAAASGNLRFIERALELDPCALERKDEYGQTALLWAASKGHLEVVKLLHEKGANPCAATDNTAVIQSTKDSVKRLTAAGSDHWSELPTQEIWLKFYQTFNGCTSLHWAIANKHTEVVRYLAFNAPKLLEIPEANGNTPLMCTYANKQPELFDILIQAGAQRTDILMAAEKGDLTWIKTEIKKNKALLECTDSFEQTPLLWAAAKGHVELCQFLLNEGATFLNVASTRESHKDHGKTPLYWAAERKHHQVVALLLKKAGPSALIALGARHSEDIPIKHVAEAVVCLAQKRLLSDRIVDILSACDERAIKLAKAITFSDKEKLQLGIVISIISANDEQTLELANILTQAKDPDHETLRLCLSFFSQEEQVNYCRELLNTAYARYRFKMDIARLQQRFPQIVVPEYVRQYCEHEVSEDKTLYRPKDSLTHSFTFVENIGRREMDRKVSSMPSEMKHPPPQTAEQELERAQSILKLLQDIKREIKNNHGNSQEIEDTLQSRITSLEIFYNSLQSLQQVGTLPHPYKQRVAQYAGIGIFGGTPLTLLARAFIPSDNLDATFKKAIPNFCNSSELKFSLPLLFGAAAIALLFFAYAHYLQETEKLPLEEKTAQLAQNNASHLQFLQTCATEKAYESAHNRIATFLESVNVSSPRNSTFVGGVI